MLRLVYTAISPFCRKVRMAMEFKGLEFEVTDVGDIARSPAFNRRAEVPILIDGDVVVANSADIVEYLELVCSGPSLFPTDRRLHARARDWQRTADTLLDAAVTNVGLWLWADMPPMPAGMKSAAEAELASLFDELETVLDGAPFVCGDLSIADFALYPHVTGAIASGLGPRPDRHRAVTAWRRRMRSTPFGESDSSAAREWWATREGRDEDRERINWGAHRLEWMFANGFGDFVCKQIAADRVLWSVGPRSNARRFPQDALRPG